MHTSVLRTLPGQLPAPCHYQPQIHHHKYILRASSQGPTPQARHQHREAGVDFFSLFRNTLAASSTLSSRTGRVGKRGRHGHLQLGDRRWIVFQK
jgi:hypothetical protein